MPRHADPDLEKRVLDAAQKLWQGGGDEKLSLRKLARAARTNTPAIYRRFPNRKAILRGLLLRLRMDLYEALKSSASLEDACERYLDFALSRPREYELYLAHFHELFGAARAHASKVSDFGPSFLWVQSKLSDHLGGTPADHLQLTLTLWALAHGTAMLLISRATPPELATELRIGCRRAVGDLVQKAALKAKQS